MPLPANLVGFGRGGAAPPAPAYGGGGGFQIQGNLPFSGGGKDYQSAYNAALQMNSINYQNILAGYQQTAAAQQQQQGAIQAGYGNLQASVLGGIQGIDQAQRQSLDDQYAQQRGATSQQLINRGLGNSTVQQSVDRGLLLDNAKANVALTNSTQGINAQYHSQLGLAGLGYQSQALQQNTGLANQQLQWMNSVQAAYPDARMYAELDRMKGASAGGGMGAGGYSQAPTGKSPFKGSGGPSPASYGAGGYGRPAPPPHPPGRPSPYSDAPEPSEIYPTNQADFGTGYLPGGNWWESTDSTGVEPDAYKDLDTSGTWFEDDSGGWSNDSTGGWVAGDQDWGEEGTDWTWDY